MKGRLLRTFLVLLAPCLHAPAALGSGYALLATAWLQARYPEKRLRFLNRGVSGDRAAVSSAGAVARINIFGFAVAQFSLARPFQRPGRGWLWQFTLAPGF